MRIAIPVRLLVGALSAVLLSSGVATAQDPVQLTATVLGTGPTPVALRAVVDQWNKDNPGIQVRVETRPDSDTWQTAAPSTEFAASDGPDLSWWWCARAQGWRDMSETGMLAPLDDLYASQGWNTAFPQGTLDYFKDPVDGHYYGVQVDTVFTPIVFYNKDIFDKLELTEPKTWEEFYAVTAALAKAGYIPLSALYGMQLQNHLPQALMLRSWTQEEYDAFTQNWSGKADPATFEHKWTDPNSVRIFQTIKDMADHKVFGDGFQALTDPDQAKSLFQSQQAAMYVMGVWEADNAVAEAPFNADWFYYPPIGDQKPLGVVGTWPADCVIVFQNRAHVAEAKQFVSYLLSPAGMAIFAKALSVPPGRTDLSSELLGSALGANTVKICRRGRDPRFGSPVGGIHP